MISDDYDERDGELMRSYILGIITGISVSVVMLSCLVILNVEAVRECFPPP